MVQLKGSVYIDTCQKKKIYILSVESYLLLVSILLWKVMLILLAKSIIGGYWMVGNQEWYTHFCSLFFLPFKCYDKKTLFFWLLANPFKHLNCINMSSNVVQWHAYADVMCFSLTVRERTVKVIKGTGDYPWGFRIQFSKPILVTEVDTSKSHYS